MTSFTPLTEEFRPYNLDDIVGQNSAVELLKHDVLTEEYKPLYLATGPFGSGKTTAIRAFARAANCLDRDGVNACGKCDNCVDMDRGAAPFYVEIDASNNSKVEDVRNLVDSLRHSARGLRKFVALDECHNLSPQAMDTLLKPTEDPSSTYSFIFITSEFHKIKKGIVTRSTRLPFKPLGTDEILNYLENIVETKGMDISESGLVACAERSMGSMRQAIKNLETVAILGDSLEGEEEGGLWDEYLDSLYDKDLAGVLVSVSDLLKRDTVSAQDVLNRTFTEVRDGIVSGDKRWGGETGTHAITELSRASAKMNSSGTDRIALEAGLVSLLNPPHKDLERYVRRSVAEALKNVDFSAVEIVAQGGTELTTSAPEKPTEAPKNNTADVAPEYSEGGGAADNAAATEEGPLPEGDGTEEKDNSDLEDPWGNWDGGEAITAIAEAEAERLREAYGEDSADPEEIADGLQEIESMKGRMANAKKVPADSPEEARNKIREMGKEEYAQDVASKIAGDPDLPESLGDGSRDSVIGALQKVKDLAVEDNRNDVVEAMRDIIDFELEEDGDVILVLYTDSGVDVASYTREYVEETLDVDVDFVPDFEDD